MVEIGRAGRTQTLEGRAADAEEPKKPEDVRLPSFETALSGSIIQSGSERRHPRSAERGSGRQLVASF